MKNPNRAIINWLLIGAFLVIAMVVVGGYTRLSHSGLSMVSWKPVTGWLPPMSDAAWNDAFQDYQATPEYIKRNYDFTMAEFKQIFWPEFIHRLLGRVIGLVFIIPFLFFLIKKKIQDRKLKINLIVIFILGGVQAFIGWYMVKSGLVDRPDVSHYRLALHLTTALTLFGYILWTAFGILYERTEIDKAANSIRKWLYGLFGLLGLQIVYGAFVAGLDAGKFYDTFPTMGGDWMPETVSSAMSQEGFASFLESPYVVQFMHRWVAALVVLMVIWIFIRAIKISITELQRKALLFVLAAVMIQFTLGVLTIINLTPVALGIIHQLGAVVLLSAVLLSIYSFSKPKA